MDRLSYPFPKILYYSPDDFKEMAARILKKYNPIIPLQAAPQIIEELFPNLTPHRDVLNHFFFVTAQKLNAADKKNILQDETGKGPILPLAKSIQEKEGKTLEEAKHKARILINSDLLNAIKYFQEINTALKEKPGNESQQIAIVANILAENQIGKVLFDAALPTMEELVDSQQAQRDHDFATWDELLPGIDSKNLHRITCATNQRLYGTHITIIPDADNLDASGIGLDLPYVGGIHFRLPGRYLFAGKRNGFGFASIFNKSSEIPYEISACIYSIDKSFNALFASREPHPLLDALQAVITPLLHDEIHSAVLIAPKSSDNTYAFDNRPGPRIEAWNENLDRNNWQFPESEVEHFSALTRSEILNRRFEKDPALKENIIQNSLRYLQEVKAFVETIPNINEKRKTAEYLACIGTYPLFAAFHPDSSEIAPIRKAIDELPMLEGRADIPRITEIFFGTTSAKEAALPPHEKIKDTHGKADFLKEYVKVMNIHPNHPLFKDMPGNPKTTDDMLEKLAEMRKNLKKQNTPVSKWVEKTFQHVTRSLKNALGELHFSLDYPPLGETVKFHDARILCDALRATKVLQQGVDGKLRSLKGFDLVRQRILEQTGGHYEILQKRRFVFFGTERVSASEVTKRFYEALEADGKVAAYTTRRNHPRIASSAEESNIPPRN